MNIVYTGLDVGSRSFQLATMRPDGTIICNRRFLMSEANLITAFAALEGEIHVHLEAGELAPWIRETITPLVHRVVISDPKTNSWIANDPQKCDQIDALKLADLLRMHRFREVYIAHDQSRREFKQLVQHHADLTRQQAAIKRKIKARFRAQGIILQTAEPFSAKGREKALARLSSAPIRAALMQLYQVLDQSRAMQEQSRQLMLKQSRAFPEVKLLQTIPGIGPIGAARFSAYVQTPHRFGNRRKLWRDFRLGISFRSSDGKSLSHPRLDSNGCGLLKDVARKAFDAAARRTEPNSFQRAYEQALVSTRNKVHARLSVMRKIVSVMRAVWISQSPYRDELG